MHTPALTKGEDLVVDRGRRRKLRARYGRLELSLVPERYMYPTASFGDNQEVCANDQVNELTSPGYGKIPYWKVLIYAIPSGGFYGLKYAKSSFMLSFYAEDYPQVSLSILSFFSVLGVLVDAFTDPYVSNWTDSIKYSRYGRRKPFLLVAALAGPVVIGLAYSPP